MTDLTPVELVVAALATFRLTWFIVYDRITQPARRWVVARSSRRHGSSGSRPPRGVAYLVTCPWCVSPYVATLVVAAYLILPADWWMAATLIAALSAVAGLLSLWSAD